MGLGRISEEEAGRARENIQQLESDGMVGNFLHLYKMDVERARCFILGDPASDPNAIGEN